MEKIKKTSYELPLSSEEIQKPIKHEFSKALQLQNNALYYKNAVWFCQLRWLVVLFFILYGIGGFIPDVFIICNLKSNLCWPFAIALVLTIANIVFYMQIKNMRADSITEEIKIYLWTQIIFDLIVITVVINRTGSLHTNVPFFYLFHIILACIFFSRIKSLFITIACIILYLLNLFLEISGVFPGSSLYNNDILRSVLLESYHIIVINLSTSIFVWITVWFLTSHISAMLKEQERDLTESKFRLEKSQEERMNHMMRTTHELKAPFAAIHANTQLLLRGYCGSLPEEAITVINKISDRSRRLTNAIRLMLQLANLRSATEIPKTYEKMDLAKIIDYCITQISQIAVEYSITIKTNIQSVMVNGVEDHLKMLFINLFSNAIFYSYNEGAVFINCSLASEGNAQVIIEDSGIGIAAEKIHSIFNEYYRTEEAAKHNKNSSGLGLAIVKHVAITHKIKITVESILNCGTKFILNFPKQ